MTSDETFAELVGLRGNVSRGELIDRLALIRLIDICIEQQHRIGRLLQATPLAQEPGDE